MFSNFSKFVTGRCLSFELQILNLKSDLSSAVLFGLPFFSVFPEFIDLRAKLLAGSFESSEVHNFGQVLTKMEFYSRELDLEQKGSLSVFPSSCENFSVSLLLGDP